MKYSVEMGSGAITYIRSSIQTSLCIQKLKGDIRRDTDSMVIS
jgi:hypothetical protein